MLSEKSDGSELDCDPVSLTLAGDSLRHVQSVLHPQMCRPSDPCPSLDLDLSLLLTSESSSCRPNACHSDDCLCSTSLTHSQEYAQCLTLPSSAN